jgi:protein-S-isoprenylcysteine O-methyltransferase Ste14
MWTLCWSLALAGWFAWLYPFLFRAPHRQNRASITLATPTRLGLLLECLAILLAFLFRLPVENPPGPVRIVAAVALVAACSVMGWQSVVHLGRQFRVHAGLYHDHRLVRTGPYSLVRHPIYASLFGMLLSTILLLTRWEWGAVAVAVFIAGTEIRVRTEDGLLASRFGDEFHVYRKSVPAYIPFVR